MTLTSTAKLAGRSKKRFPRRQRWIGVPFCLFLLLACARAPSTGLGLHGGAAASLRPPGATLQPEYCSENGVRLVQTMQVGPRIPVGAQLEKAEVGPSSGPTWRPPHLRARRPAAAAACPRAGAGRPADHSRPRHRLAMGGREP
jgi:hypothetical protein